MATPFHAIVWHEELCAALGLASWLRLSQVARSFRSAMQSASPTEVLALMPHTPMDAVVALQRSWPLLRFSYEASGALNHTMDLQNLANLHSVSITRCHGFTHVHALKRVQSVKLDSCDGVVDISGLSAAQSVTVRTCPHITNESLAALTQLDELTVYRCIQLTNFTTLESLRRLSVEASNQHSTAVQVNAPQLEFLRLVLVTYHPAQIAHVRTVELVHARSLGDGPAKSHASYACHHSRLTDVAWLSKVTHVDLTGSWCLQDISPLKHASSVNLTGCSAVTDVSPLAKVKRINLTHCFRVTDVSALGDVDELNLTGCWNIQDVSALGRVHTLNLTGVGKVTSIDQLRHVHTLVLSGNRFVTQLPVASSIQSISITDCILITDLTPLHGIPTVHIDGLRMVRSVAALAKATSVDISNCPLLADVSALANVPKVRLAHCSSITDVTPLSRAKSLALERVPFESAAALAHIPHLTIESCWGFKGCEMLPATVRLHGCGCDNHLYTHAS